MIITKFILGGKQKLYTTCLKTSFAELRKAKWQKGGVLPGSSCAEWGTEGLHPHPTPTGRQVGVSFK